MPFKTQTAPKEALDSSWSEVLRNAGLKSQKNISIASMKKSGLKLKPLSFLVKSNGGLEDLSKTEQKIDFGNIDLTKLKATNDIDIFVGDVSLNERQLLFSLWKLLNKQIGPLTVVRCPQCEKTFSGRSQLSRHLATICTDLIEEFFAQLEDYFSSKLTLISSEWNVMNAFEFLKEKIFAFMDHRWCLLCGKTTPTNAWSPTNSGSLLTNHMIHAHFKMDFAVYSQPIIGKARLLQCPLPEKNARSQSCGFRSKSEGVLFEHLGADHSLVDDLLNTTVDVNAIDGTAPSIEDGPTGSDFIKCTNCGKCFANNISLKIHKATEEKDLVKIVKDSNMLRCGYKNCTHTAKSSDEEIIRHSGMVHLEVTIQNSVPKVFQSTPKTTSQIVPFITPLEPAEDDEIVEIMAPKKVYEIIDIDDQEEVTTKDNFLPENRIVPAEPKNDPKTLHSIGVRKNCIDWNNFNKSAKVMKHVEDTSSTPPVPSSILAKQYRSTPLVVKCPVCNAIFNLVTLLHQHLSTKHFRSKLTAMVSPDRKGGFSCPDPHCNFSGQAPATVVQHIATYHLMAFDIAKKMFPEFSIPAPIIGSRTSSSKCLSVLNGKKRNSAVFINPNEPKRVKLGFYS